MILAGDIGGTNTRLAFFAASNGHLKMEHEQVFQSARHKSLSEITDQFLLQNDFKPTGVCIGFAGPIRNGQAMGTNLPWNLNIKELAAHMRLDHAWLINDLVANAYGLQKLPASDFSVINVGDPDTYGNAGLISAGTGLGEAGMFFDGTKLCPFPSEGSHADFAPANELQIDLFRYLQKEYGGHVSWERVVSGPGLLKIYTFLRDTGHGEEPEWLASKLKDGDAAAHISEAALLDKSALCRSALDIFISCYGAEAGNLALKLMATQGIFLGGGIAPKIGKLLATPTFMDAFLAKGRFAKVLQQIPIKIILNDQTALLGAAHYASLHTNNLSTPLKC